MKNIVNTRQGRYLLVALMLIAATDQAKAFAEPNVPPRADAAQLQSIDARRKLLFAAMLQDPSNLDTAFEYAALSSQAGDLEGAISTLERMLIFAPGLPRLQLELGVLYFRLGAYETARTYFDAALAAPDVPADVRDKVQPYLAGIDAKAGDSTFGGALLFGLRYQSNANAGPNSRSVSLNGLDFLLDRTAKSSSDLNAYGSANLSYSFDLPGQGDRFDLSLSTFAGFYAQRQELNIGVAELSGGPVFDLNRFGLSGSSFGIYAIAGGALLSGDPFLGSIGAGSVLSSKVTPADTITLRSEYRYEDYRNSGDHPTASNRTGDTYRNWLSFEHALTETVTLQAVGSVERHVASADFNSYWQTGGLVGVNIRYASPLTSLPSPWSIAASVELYGREYDRPDTLISSREERDRDFAVRLSQTVPLADSWTLQLQASYRDVWSNYDTRKFDNVSASLGFQKTF